MLFLRFWRFC